MQFKRVAEFKNWIDGLNEAGLLSAYVFATLDEIPTNSRYLHRLVYNYCTEGFAVNAFDVKNSKLQIFKTTGMISDVTPRFEIEVPDYG